MSEFSLILVLRKENKQNSDMSWQRYKLNLRNLLFWEKNFRPVRLKRAESPKTLSPGHRPEYNSNQQDALTGREFKIRIKI